MCMHSSGSSWGASKILFMRMHISKFRSSRLRAFLVNTAYKKDHQLTTHKTHVAPGNLFGLHGVSKIFEVNCYHLKMRGTGFPGGSVVENPPAKAGDTGSSPGLGRSHLPWSS